MEKATTDSEFTEMFRQLLDRMRDRVAGRLGDLDQGSIEKALSSLLAAGATAILLLGNGKKYEGVLGWVMSSAARYLAKHASEAPRG